MVTTAPVQPTEPPGEQPIRIEDEMRTSYLTYAMSVIVREGAPGCTRRVEAGAAAHPICNARHGHPPRFSTPQERAYRR